MAEFQVLTTKRGGKSLIIDGYRFRFHQTCATKKQWKCVEPKMCKGEMLQGVMTHKGTLGRNVTGRNDTQRNVRAKCYRA